MELGTYRLNAVADESRRTLTLAGDLRREGGCVWAEPTADDPDRRPRAIEFPEGWRAVFPAADAAPQRFRLLDPTGRDVGGNGDRVEAVAYDWPPDVPRCRISDRAALRLARVVTNLGSA